MTTKIPRTMAPSPGADEAVESGRYAVASNEAGSGRIAESQPPYAAAPATITVSATDAARRFSDLISRACYQGETFVIERGGRAICQLAPLDSGRCTGADLLTLLAKLPRPDEEFLAAVETASREQPMVELSPWER